MQCCATAKYGVAAELVERAVLHFWVLKRGRETKVTDSSAGRKCFRLPSNDRLKLCSSKLLKTYFSVGYKPRVWCRCRQLIIISCTLSEL